MTVSGSKPSAEERKGHMEQVIERAGTGLGNGVGLVADSGGLFVVFAMIWVAFGVGLIWSQGSVDAVWETVRGWPMLVEGIVWLLFLPVMLGMWIWETAWPQVLRVALVLGLAGWTLVMFPKPWR